MKANLSDADREQVEKLRQLVKDEITPYYDTDFNLLRWLKGHNYNFNEIHGLTGDAVKTPNAVVNIEQTGANDYWGMMQTYPLNEIMKARIHDLETMLRAVMDREAKTGEQNSVLYIMDLTNLVYDKRLLGLTTGALASISAFMSEHYVEMIHSFVLVSAPAWIATIWQIARPLLPERTRNKVQILGSNWRKEILDLAVADSLPAYWNGPGEDVYLADVERAVSFNPDGYYKGGPLSNAETTTVPAGKTAFVERVGSKGQKLKWTFQADGHFAYSVYCTEDPAETDPKKMKPVYPRFNKVPGPTQVPLSDEVRCEYNGTYKFWFSNEHAWLHTLKVHHQITVLNEKEYS
ncbi:CRAL/TRIO domain-containing protein [Aphelenchoides avenae]|nr:CRAL/TRIO domain-containing protein [Aphelenchus avenae]